MPHTGLHIIVPSPTDAAAVAAMWRLSIEHLCVRDHHRDPKILATWTGNKTTDGLAAAFAESGLRWRLAVDDSRQIMGVGLLGSDGTVRAVYVHPDHTGRGVGSLLLGTLEDIARAEGLPFLRLESTATAHGFYRRHGFHDVPPPVIQFGVTAYPMEKAIPSAVEAD